MLPCLSLDLSPLGMTHFYSPEMRLGLHLGPVLTMAPCATPALPSALLILSRPPLKP